MEECMRSFTRSRINVKDIDKITLGEFYYKIDYIDGTSREVSLEKNISKPKLLTRK